MVLIFTFALVINFGFKVGKADSLILGNLQQIDNQIKKQIKEETKQKTSKFDDESQTVI